MRCLFISDAHYPKSKAVEEFLLLNYSRFDKIFIIGDLFEFYYGYKNFLYPHHMGLINILKHISKKQELFLFEGNHEYKLENIKHFLNANIIKHSLDMKIDNLKIHMEHGDMVDKNDKSYRLFRTVLKNPITLGVIDRIPFDFLLYMSKKASAFSKKRLKNKRYRRVDFALEDYAGKLIKNGNDVVILAHTHNPVKKKIENGIYINCGDFFKTFSYVTYSTNDGFMMKYYKGDTDERW